MNSLWPAAPRFSCLNPRTLLQSCSKTDSLAARLAQRFIRPYSVSSFPIHRRDVVSIGQPVRIWKFSRAKCKLSAGIRTFASHRIIRKFEDLPESYRDEEGLDFRRTPLRKEETIAIFGKIIDVNTANRMLRVLHGRRVAGTLGDPQVVKYTAYEAEARRLGLAWLRKNVSVDEIECAGQRAEKELAEMEAEIVSDAERIGLYKPNSGTRDNVYGDSVFDRVRKHNEKMFDEKEAEERKQMSQADEIRQNTGTLQTTQPRSRVELRRPGENPRLKYYLERAKVLPDKPPDMSIFQRLWPSGLLTLAVILGSSLFAYVYTPPRADWRMWPDMPPSAATIIAIILANAIVLGAWHFPPAFRGLNKFFMMVPGYPRAVALIGAVFSHQTVTHFASNMIFLWIFGTRLHDEIGRGNFLAVYLISGVFGGFISLSSWVIRNNLASSSVGASCAVAGVMATYLLSDSKEKMKLFGVFPPENWPSISSLALLCLMIGTDVLCLWKRQNVVSIDHWGHLGGYAAGIAAAGWFRFAAEQKQRREMERRKGLVVDETSSQGKA
ncbi:hypothetical protein LZ554_005206 [Drepanopeziza brunnea f. sp. 'monogermtubi']|nr:hypothetical protein LZ554_005206 [Drepanopeziza brunnea f. sp. 'monogermtubi']